VDTDRLKATWHEVTLHGDDVALYFYAHLFVTHPEVREMFPLTMDAQRDRLVGALGRIVSNVDELHEVVPYVEQLGRDHRRFAVIAQHYDAVGASLLWTLKHFLGDGWTAEVARDWADAYGLVAATMVGAAEAAEDQQPAWWDAEITEVSRVSREIAVVRIRPHSPLPYRPGQSVAVTIPQAPRVWRYFTPANAPREDSGIEFHVGVVPGGLVSGPFVSKARPGDTIRLGAPVGTALTIDPWADSDLLMVAGGTGIAPFMALLEEIEQGWREGRTSRRVHLVHGARYPWSLYAGARLAAYAQSPWFTYTEVVSDDPTYPGTRGLAGDAAAATPMPGPYDALVCGSPLMVSHTTAALTRGPRPPRSISFEEFSISPEPPVHDMVAAHSQSTGGST
jgi:NAD(P)H-flavin reductase/hemoglobin-like flavoprotein